MANGYAKFLRALAVVWAGLAQIPAFAQDLHSGASEVPPPLVPEIRQHADAAAVSGPTIYVVDKFRRLATINLGTKAVHIIGTTSPMLTDIAFNPKNHLLYGITFTGFYVINKATAGSTYIGSLGVSDANALVFDANENCYSAGVNTGDLYYINTKTGRAAVVGSTHGYASSGDLTFYNDSLVLTGFKGAGNVGTTTPNYLVKLNQATGATTGTPVLLPLKEIFGLVSTGKNELYGLALYGNDAGLYQIFPTAANTTGRAVLLEDLTAKAGLGQILGAAYDGNYQP